MKFLSLIILVLFFASCGQNHHLTLNKPSLSEPVPAPSPGPSPFIVFTGSFTGPFNVGDTISLGGSCSADGALISIPNPDVATLSPASPQNCTCSGNPGVFDCGEFTVISVAGADPVIEAELTNPDNSIALVEATALLFNTSKVAFNYTGSVQDIVIPVGAASLTVKLWGAGGGGGRGYSNVVNYGGPGSFVSAKFDLSDLPSTDLKAVVGSGGGNHSDGSSLLPAFLNGGTSGTGTCGNGIGGGGGGLSGLFYDSINQANALIVSGSGGGASNSNGSSGSGFTSRGGLGGTPSLPATAGSNSVQSSAVTGGGAASTTAGGLGGSGTRAGSAGSALAGGSANAAAAQCSGGGGAGYYGGGGGGSSSSFNDSAGGGGSGFVLGSATLLAEQQGLDLFAPNEADIDYSAGVGVGGDTGSNGGDGLIVLIWE